MYRFACLVVLCVCASMGVCRDLMRTSADLDGTASGLESRAAMDQSDVMINLNVFEYYNPSKTNTGTVVKLKRFKRNFIGTDNCPRYEVRFLGVCVTCEQYEESTGADCPLYKQ